MTATIETPSAPALPPRQSPVRRLLALLRNAWRGLTSMRTALMLLFLLALAAIPGALLPQRSLNAGKVDDYIRNRPTLGPWMDRLQLFDVFSSAWFTAVYVLLFVSLVGCILPRCLDHYRALRTPPVKAPRNLSRLPHHYSGSDAATPEQAIERARAQMRGWRTVVQPGNREGELTLSAEKGYTRELGNLVFHLALVGLLAAVAIGKLFGYEGNVVVLANDGPGFCTTSPAVFDSFRAGNVNDGTGLTPMCVRVKDFKADYLPNGQASMFTSNIRYQTGKDLNSDPWRDTTIQVNHPLRVAGDRVYLQGHGFAPKFTVTFPNGQTRTEAIQWKPDDATTFLSSGVLRIDPPGGMYPSEDERRKHQVAIQGLFAPTALMHGQLLTSRYPAMKDPAVAIDIYQGDTGLDTGRAQSLFALDPEMIKQGRLVKQQRVNLKPGESATLADGTKVTFDGAEEFVNLQVSHDPAQQWVLVSALTMMAGLLVSLLVKRRRIWLRVYPGAETDGVRRTVVEMGGLARTDQAGWGGEFDRLRERLLTGEK
ncbi:cytochrome c biogenesis protein ResB [Nocardia seriolae]|uniref:Membrane protein n=1 Tax=Nocardia seriolae TaxID=37332 RepID=A0A0B8NG10_9NOCA|nr:cytochrome c biogenesis protein ResB [Nocardia seriolae]MTJ60564.1 cytochrome C biogenesis protein ResB [Nocardia seriolae]MTJ72205.1 cytochrome C biogenesis protein ResB [Nocardia seriolae]MTJ84552.1 cytochrome C biogenesis protein ResB [Nocardia seriolae]MTK28540.1 cytochrome C biogenesis protein ResB [Nocardia seriolae]MTK38548.1 cytochrome C biogenesis protein ResB [Nocardia seriolae]